MQRLNSIGLDALIEKFAPAIAAGAVTVISVEAVRERSGDRWDRKRDQVATFLERCFARTAGPGALLAALNEVEFIAMQPEVSTLAAVALGAAVLRETLTFFLGVADREDVRIFHVKGYAGGELLVEPVDRVEITEVQMPDLALTAGGGAPPVTPSAAPRQPQWLVDGEPDLAVTYAVEPIWNIAQKVVTAYHLRSNVVSIATGQPATLSRSADAKLAAMTVTHAGREISAGLARGTPFAVHAPVPFSALASTAMRQPVLHDLKALPPAVRRLLVADITELQDGLPPSRLAEAVACLAPDCRAVLARSPSPAARMSGWAQCRLAGISLDCSSLNPRDGAAHRRLAAFAERADQISKTLVGYDLASRSLTLAAWAAGFTHVTGSAVRRQPEPRAMRWGPRDLYLGGGGESA